jgi:hypothetical protein
MQQQIEQALRKIIEFHNFNSNEGFSCLIPDKDPYPSNEGLLLWFSSKTRIETKVQLFHSPPRIRRMEEMLNLPEKEYVKLFFGYLEDFLNALRDIGFETIGKGVDLFGKGKLFNVKADFDLFESNPEALKEFEAITLNNSIVKFAEEQGYFNCTNRDHSVWDDFASGIDFSAVAADPDSAKPAKASAKGQAKKAKEKEVVAEATPEKKTKVVAKSKSKSKTAAKTSKAKPTAAPKKAVAKSTKAATAKAPVKAATKATAKVTKAAPKTTAPKAKAKTTTAVKAKTTSKAKGKVTKAKVTKVTPPRLTVTTSSKSSKKSKPTSKKKK